MERLEKKQRLKSGLLRRKLNSKKEARALYDKFFLESKEVIGVDEVGRGCLSGPVVSVACILRSDKFFSILGDSKSLSPEKRRYIFDKLNADGTISYSVGIVNVPLIDQMNILQASLMAMAKAVECLSGKNTHCCFVDGIHVPENTLVSQYAVPQGDSCIPAISAASILAKVLRDQMMVELSRFYPEYAMEQHKGYGTRQHRLALTKLGPTALHRKGFSYKQVS